MFWDWARAVGPSVSPEVRGVVLRTRTWEEQRASVFLLHVISVFAIGVAAVSRRTIERCAASVWNDYETELLPVAGAWRVLQENGLVLVHDTQVDTRGLAGMGAWLLDWFDPSFGAPDQMRELPVILDVVDWVRINPRAFARDEYRALLLAIIAHTAESLRIRRCLRANQLADDLITQQPDCLNELIDRGIDRLAFSTFEEGATLLAAVWNTTPEARNTVIARLGQWASRADEDLAMVCLVAIRWRAREREALEALLEERVGWKWHTYEYPRVGY